MFYRENELQRKHLGFSLHLTVVLIAKLCLFFVFGSKGSFKEMLASKGCGLKQFLPGSL